jgi:hypothetical protein
MLEQELIHSLTLILLNDPSKLACSILSRTVATAAAGIRALLVSCHSEAPRLVLMGGAACSTFRSTMSRNGTSCCFYFPALS